MKEGSAFWFSGRVPNWVKQEFRQEFPPTEIEQVDADLAKLVRLREDAFSRWKVEQQKFERLKVQLTERMNAVWDSHLSNTEKWEKVEEMRVEHNQLLAKACASLSARRSRYADLCKALYGEVPEPDVSEQKARFGKLRYVDSFYRSRFNVLWNSPQSTNLAG